MPRTWPTEADALAFLEAAGLKKGSAAPPDLGGHVAAARRQFEAQTGYRPFVAGGADVAVTLETDPDKLVRVLPLPSGLRSLTSLTSSGVPLTAGRDFTLQPADAPLDGRPYEWIRLTTWRAATWVVTGRWGRVAADDLPEDAFRAVLAYVAVAVAPELERALTGGLSSWSEAGVTETYGANPLATLVESWQAQWDRVVASYRRVTLGL